MFAVKAANRGWLQGAGQTQTWLLSRQSLGCLRIQSQAAEGLQQAHLLVTTRYSPLQGIVLALELSVLEHKALILDLFVGKLLLKRSHLHAAASGEPDHY